MKPIYKKLLKELKKGNAVLLEVRGRELATRYRLITPNNCEFVLANRNDRFALFNQSCFLDPLKLTPKDIVKTMSEYDYKAAAYKWKMQVLK